MAVKTSSISADERSWRQIRAAADTAGLSVSAWMVQAAREKLQRDAAVGIAELDRSSRNAWAAWSETSERDFEAPDAASGAA